jgi:hypothetical protein
MTVDHRAGMIPNKKQKILEQQKFYENLTIFLHVFFMFFHEIWRIQYYSC